MLIIKLLAPHRLVVAYLWSLNILLNVVSIVCIITTFVQCTPISFYWTRQGNGTCWDPKIVANLAITQGSMSAFTDFSLAIFPITVMWNLQIALKKKMAVWILMGFGSIASIAAIIRTTKLSKLAQQTDVTWYFWTLVLWVAIECCIIIIGACVPCLRPLANKLLGEYVRSTFSLLFSRRRKDTSEASSYALQSRGDGKFVKISATEADTYGSRTSLSGGIKTTTNVEIRYSN